MKERLLTLEEYADLPESPGWREELDCGRLIREPHPSARHGRIVINAAVALETFAKSRGHGKVFTECGFALSERPATVRGPDVAFVSAHRLAPETPMSWYRFGPDLAIEVLSPSNRAHEMNRKINQYFKAGTREVWVIDPRNEIVIVHKPDGHARVLGANDEISSPEILPDFRIPVAELLAD